ncbi:MAG: CehA/McbA family metallohydrolase [archaeon]|nr:CehA/McbA family metallohydrolase [archaeon]
MKADLHVHTNYSEDGKTTPQQVIDRCIEEGIGCVAITDHNSFKAYFDVKDNGKVIVIPGEEVSSTEGHILAFGIDREIPKGLGIQETIDAIHEAGGYAFAAHPYRWWSGLGEKNTLNYPFDGVEARNAKSIPSANVKSMKLAKKIGKPISAGSDAHTPAPVGNGYVDLPDDIVTWQDAVKAIMDYKAVPKSKSRHFIATLSYGFKTIGAWMFRGFKKM